MTDPLTLLVPGALIGLLFGLAPAGNGSEYW